MLVLILATTTAASAQEWTKNPPGGTIPNATDDAVCKTNSQIQISVKPNGQVGIGNTAPNARLELKYCPTGTTNQPGFFINRLECVNMGTPTNPVINPPTYGFGDTTMPAPEGWSVTPGKYNLVAITNTSTPFVFPTATPDQPLFVIRKEQLGSNFTPTAAYNQYENKFIVMPNGNTGINTANPRAALDVRALSATNEPAAIFGSIASSTYTAGSGGVAQYKTQCLQYIPRLSTDAFNKIVQGNDQGLFFSDGKGAEGANLNGTFVLAPWANPANAANIGGLRMDNLGNIEVHGKLKSTRINVNAKWWADDVFSPDYKLRPLSEVAGFISANKHLPEVPNESAILSGGIDVSEMLAIQMKKTEELTLYLIQMQKTIDELNTKLKALEEKGN